MKKGLVVILAAATALYFVAKKSLSSKLIFQLQDIGTSGKWYAPVLIISVRVLNPSNQSAQLNSITGELSLNGKFISNITSFVPQKIAAKAESVIKLEAKPGVTGAASVILTALQKKGTGYKAKFVGNANVDGIVIPINETFAI
jgi:hypothetical protein